MLKNIIIVNDFDYIQGGASKVAIDTANLLCDKYNVFFFSGATIGENELRPEVKKICTNQGEVLRDRNKIRGFFNGIYNYKAKKTLKNLLISLDKKETIIHIHGWTKILSSSIFDIAWKLKFKVVVTMHDYFIPCPNGGYYNYKSNKICDNLKPMSLKCATCNCDSRNYMFKLYRIIRHFVQNKVVKLNDKLTDVISISQFSENVLRKTLKEQTRIHRIYNPIEFTQESKNPNVPASERNYYLYVGRVSKEKGVDIFCEAIKKYHLKGIVVGDGDQKKTLEQTYPFIKFVGWKDKEEVKGYMQKAKALILPSRWYEGAPLTPLEAISNGTKCFVSNCCSAVDYVDDKAGILEFDINDLDIPKLEYKSKEVDPNYVKEYLKKFNTAVYKKNIMKLYKKMSDME